MGWSERVFSFTADGTVTTLAFESLSTPPPPEPRDGPALDNVRISAPAYLSASGSVTYVENALPAIVAPALIVDGTEAISGAKASIGANFNGREDSLVIVGTLPVGLTASYSAATGVLTLSGTAPTAVYQQALRQVGFVNSSQNPNVAPRTVTFNIGTSLAFAGTGHFYQFVPGYISWTSANAAVQSKTLFGLQGYLATITSGAENGFIKNKLQGNGWLGGSDAAIESQWKWVSGPESIPTPTTIGGPGYTNWNTGEPNNAGNEDYLHMIGNASAGPLGTWNDLPNMSSTSGAYSVLGYIVEYGGMPGDPTSLQLSGDVTVNVVPVNDPPTADAGGPYSVNEGASITLNGTGTDIVAEGTAVSFSWDLDNDGIFETPGQNVTFSGVDGPGLAPVSVKVCDAGTPLPAACTVATVNVTVNNVAPTVGVNVNSGNTVYYVDWTAANPAAGTASGVITLPNGDTLGVRFDALNPITNPTLDINGAHSFFDGAQTSGGTNFWNPSAPYISTEVPNAPPASDIIRLSGGSNTIYTVTLTEPIADPIMAVESLGGANAATYEFDQPFTLLSNRAGYHGGNATTLKQLPGNVLWGHEGNGTIRFNSAVSTFSWTVPTSEIWHGFTFAIRTTVSPSATLKSTRERPQPTVVRGLTLASTTTWWFQRPLET
jgi:hypothetical protein